MTIKNKSVSFIARFLHINPRSARHLCKQWVNDGFLTIVNPSKKRRAYKLNPKFTTLN